MEAALCCELNNVSSKDNSCDAHKVWDPSKTLAPTFTIKPVVYKSLKLEYVIQIKYKKGFGSLSPATKRSSKSLETRRHYNQFSGLMEVKRFIILKPAMV